MGTSNVQYYNGRYKGSLAEGNCDILEQFLELKEANGCVSDLKHCIYDLSDYDVLRLIDDFNTYGKTTIMVDRPLGTLRDYQTLGVAYMFYARDCILGDSVGMGKTIEVCGFLNLQNQYATKELGHKHRYLMLTEKKAAPQVHKELIKFTGEYVHLIPDSTKKNIDLFYETIDYNEELEVNIVGTHALLTSTRFLAWIEMYKQKHKRSPFDTLIVDESSVLGGSTSNISKAFKTIRGYFTKVAFLNATPLESKLRILYNQLNLLDKNFLPTVQNFDREYCVMDYTGMFPRPTNKYKNVEQFKKAIAYRYFASTRKENGAVMDNCYGGVITSSLSDCQRRLLHESQLTQMIFDCPSYIDDSIEFNEENVPKLKSLRELFENECSNAETIIIYVHFREAQYALKKWMDERNISNKILNGETKEKDVDEAIEGFKRGDFRVLITNVQKSLNFGNCDYCIFYSVISNPSQMVQFEGRMTRSFDIYNKHVYILCSLGKEYNNLKTTVKERAEAMEQMTSTDYSVVLTILNRLNGGK